MPLSSQAVHVNEVSESLGGKELLDSSSHEVHLKWFCHRSFRGQKKARGLYGNVRCLLTTCIQLRATFVPPNARLPGSDACSRPYYWAHHRMKEHSTGAIIVFDTPVPEPVRQRSKLDLPDFE